MSEQTPVIVGVAQNEQRISDWEDHKEPLELMHAALCAAADDSGNPQILDAASAIRWCAVSGHTRIPPACCAISSA